MSTCEVVFSLHDLHKGLWKAAGAVLVFAGLVSVAHCGSGCKPPQSTAEVEAAYTAELVSCSVHAPTLAEAKACRRAVNTKYGLCEQAQWPRITPCDE